MLNMYHYNSIQINISQDKSLCLNVQQYIYISICTNVHHYALN